MCGWGCGCGEGWVGAGARLMHTLRALPPSPPTLYFMSDSIHLSTASARSSTLANEASFLVADELPPPAATAFAASSAASAAWALASSWAIDALRPAGL